MPIKFGTDGWRAIIAEDFTFDNVRLCAQGAADLMKYHSLAYRGFVVGYDTRFASAEFAAAVAEVTAGNGIPTLLCDRAAPTPVIAYNLVGKDAGAGAVITASHNPAAYNGFQVQARLRRQRISRNRRRTRSPHRSRRIIRRGAAHITRAGNRQRLARNIRPRARLPQPCRLIRGLGGNPQRRLGHHHRLHARRGRGLPRRPALRRLHPRNRNSPRTQPRLPRHGAARTLGAQPPSRSSTRWATEPPTSDSPRTATPTGWASWTTTATS